MIKVTFIENKKKREWKKWIYLFPINNKKLNKKKRKVN